MRSVMTGLVGFLGIVAALIVAFGLYVRVAPSDPVRWHVDPVAVDPPGFPGAVLMRPGGDPDSPRFDMDPAALMAAFDRVARDAPRVTVLAGSVADRHVTYIARSAVFGFPDYISVRALPGEDGGARLAVFARLRFGYDDLGVNRARLDDWLAQTRAAAPGA